jgi:AcrR family transcriptional regulator
MTEPVNPRPSLRAERAAVTRRRIAEAARRLFARDGYGATTLQAIADEAGVAVQTVYAVFGSKAGILRDLRHSIVFQPEADELAQSAVAGAAAGDTAAALERFAHSIRVRWDVGSDVVRIAREADSTDPSLKAEQATVYDRRRAGLRGLASALGSGLRPGVSPDEALASLDALTLPDVYIELVQGLGWTSDAYEAWLAGSLRRLLIDG